MASTSSQPEARLGTAHLASPVEDSDTVSSFRGVPERAALATELGPLNDLPGRWTGSGFNLIARPHFAPGNDFFLELNLTAETLQFTTIGSPIPNRRQDPRRASHRAWHLASDPGHNGAHGARERVATCLRTAWGCSVRRRNGL